MTCPGGRPETAQKRERSRLGRPFDFRLHRARRCAKLIRCVSICARKPANVTQRAAKPISITARSRVISRNRRTGRRTGPRISQLRAIGDLVLREQGRCRGKNKKNETDVGIYRAPESRQGSTSCELRERIPDTPCGFQPCYSCVTHLPRPLNRKLKSVQLFKYCPIIKLLAQAKLREIRARNYSRGSSRGIMYYILPDLASLPIHST